MIWDPIALTMTSLYCMERLWEFNVWPMFCLCNCLVVSDVVWFWSTMNRIYIVTCAEDIGVHWIVCKKKFYDISRVCSIHFDIKKLMFCASNGSMSLTCLVVFRYWRFFISSRFWSLVLSNNWLSISAATMKNMIGCNTTIHRKRLYF